MRLSLRRPSDPDGLHPPATIDWEKPDDLLTLLPDRLPRFKPGEVAFYRFVVYNAQALARQAQGALVKLEMVMPSTSLFLSFDAFKSKSSALASHQCALRTE